MHHLARTNDQDTAETQQSSELQLCGVQLAEDLPGVSLAVSLHAPNQELRQTIVPSAKAYPLPRLLSALETYLDKSTHKGSKVFSNPFHLPKLSMTTTLTCPSWHEEKSSTESLSSCLQIFVEYVLLAGVNDRPQEAHELGRLLSHRGQQYMINLIPWNPVLSPDMHFEAPSTQSQTDFHAIVRSYGLLCTVRREMGQDISGLHSLSNCHKKACCITTCVP